jgi:G:T/U-mismatch repair DNA glycosylase
MAEIESHPLEPFLPENATMLFLGSFPPPKARWSMDFFYPNWINDFWRIMGLIHYGDKGHFECGGTEKRFDKDRITEFAHTQGMAFYDTASKVRRLRGNASDEFLEIVEPADIASLLRCMPQCHTIVTTGGKASEELRMLLTDVSGATVALPKIGSHTEVYAYDRNIRWWRMPSSSRAYPLKLEKKAEYYRQLFA